MAVPHERQHFFTGMSDGSDAVEGEDGTVSLDGVHRPEDCIQQARLGKVALKVQE